MATVAKTMQVSSLSDSVDRLLPPKYHQFDSIALGSGILLSANAPTFVLRRLPRKYSYFVDFTNNHWLLINYEGIWEGTFLVPDPVVDAPTEWRFFDSPKYWLPRRMSNNQELIN